MYPINSIPRPNKNIGRKDVHKLSRREFIKLTAITSVGLGLWLSGCAPGEGQVAGSEGPLVVVDKWIEAINSGDQTGFENLHSENVLATAHVSSTPVSGRKFVWERYRSSTGDAIAKVAAFSQGQSACLQVDSTKRGQSLCYVFHLQDDLIAQIYEYSSGSYYLSDSPHFSGIELVDDNEGLSDRIDILNNLHEAINNREKTGYAKGFADSAIWFVPTDRDPLIGAESIQKDGEVFVEAYPEVRIKPIETFGQGNLVCSHFALENAPVGALCFVADFKDGEINACYEYWSRARLDG